VRRELLGDQAAEQAAIHAHEVRHVLAHELVQDGLDLRVVSPQREDAPAGEQIEVLVSVGVPEVAAFAADVGFIEADRLEHLDERGVDMVGVQVVLPPTVLLQPLEKIVVHRGC
jgi:hypothetical protein